MLGDNRDVDPTFQLFIRSCKMLRRMCVKMPNIYRMLSDIFLKYSQAHYIGTYQGDADLAMQQPAPPPGSPNYACWQPMHRPMGPVGLLLSRSYCFGICIDCNFNLHQHKEVPVGILHTPIQFVRTLVRSMTNRARYNAAIPNRSELQGSRELDFDVLRKAVNKQEDINSVRILRHHVSLAGWTSTKLASIDRLDGEDVCICGAQCPTKLHIIRDCKHPALVKARGEAFANHEKLFKL